MPTKSMLVEISAVALPLWVELVAVGLGAAQGAMYAGKVLGARLDLTGVVLRPNSR